MQDETSTAAPWRPARVWPWLLALVIACLAVGGVSDALGWPTWVRGLLAGACSGASVVLFRRAWQRNPRG